MKKYGPGLLVMAAFIGPGTVTTASQAGAAFGFALLWALLFSIVATIILQEMAARLGLVTKQGLAEALRRSAPSPFWGGLISLLVILAIGLGNAAYESGNITGATLGLNALLPLPYNLWPLVVGGTAFTLLSLGQYRNVEAALIVLVLVMSVVFIVTMLMVGPDWGGILTGLLRPSLPTGSTLVVIALIGTTVVPYNLFLHASAVQEKWGDEDLESALKDARRDSLIAISLGGLITLAIVSTACAAFFNSAETLSPANISQQLEPLLGAAAKYFFALGLLAAGLTSAITSPLAAAYAVSGALGWEADMKSLRFKCLWATVLALGTLAAVLGSRPISAIILAQAANGFLLPIVAVFLLLVMNKPALLGEQRNRLASNILGGLVVVVVSGLSAFKLYQLL